MIDIRKQQFFDGDRDPSGLVMLRAGSGCFLNGQDLRCCEMECLELEIESGLSREIQWFARYPWLETAP